MENLRIRKAADAAGVKLWEIAEKYGLNDGNFSRKLRRELPKAEQLKVLSIIEEIRLEHEKKGD